MRETQLQRNTKETQIDLSISLDEDQATSYVSTPIGFFNHMLELFSFYSNISIDLEAQGDVDVDDHHLIEDTGILLGQALKKALGDKRGITRYGNCRLPMDEALAQVDLDFSGRPYLVFECEFHRESIGVFSTEMVEEFLRAFAFNAGMTLHIHVYGKNDHHQIEAIFKGLGRAIKQAVAIESDRLPSTKGVLE